MCSEHRPDGTSTIRWRLHRSQGAVKKNEMETSRGAQMPILPVLGARGRNQTDSEQEWTLIHSLADNPSPRKAGAWGRLIKNGKNVSFIDDEKFTFFSLNFDRNTSHACK